TIFRKMFQPNLPESKEKVLDMKLYSYEAVYGFFSNVYFSTGTICHPEMTLESKLELLTLFHTYQLERLFSSLETHIMETYSKGMEIIKILNIIERFPIVSDKIKLYCVDMIKKHFRQKIIGCGLLCYDSIKPGTNNRPASDIYPYCCMHYGTEGTSHLSKTVANTGYLTESKKLIRNSTCIYKMHHPDNSYEAVNTERCCLHRKILNTLSEVDLYKILESIPPTLKDAILKELLT
ncbi:MAG: hypothetical protein Harvfovirus61_10, partial [Harvfovirus sp.]